jgi:hypothetical protein
MTHVSLNDASILKWPKLVELWLEGDWWSSHCCQMEAQLQNKNTMVSCSSLDLQRKLLAGNVKSLRTRTFSNLYAYTSQHSCWDLPFDAMNLYILCNIARKNHFSYPDSWMLKQREGSCLSSFPRYLGNTSTWNCCLLFDLAKHTAGSWTQTELVLELLH